MTATTAPDSITSDQAKPRPRWSGLATLGLLMAAAGPLLLLAATALWGLGGEESTFFAVVAVLAGIGAFLMSRPRTAARVAAVVLALLVGLTLFWTAFGLAAPDSFFDFVAGVLVLPGALIAVGAGIASIRAGRRGHVGQSSSGAERRAQLGVVAAVGALVLLSGILTLTGRETVSGSDAAGADVVVDLSDFEFEETSYQAVGGSTVLVRNRDPFLHTFTIDALDIDIRLAPGSERLVTLPDLPGTYVLYCSPHTDDAEDPSDDDMATRLTIG